MTGSGIYQIQNETNGHRYVGQAGRTLRQRWAEHRSRLNKGKHDNAHLQNAWNLYGETAFVFEVLEHVSDREQLEEREQYWFDTLKPEYNIAPVAGSQLGMVHSEETRRKMSRARTGKVRGPQSEEHRRNLSEARMGQAVSEETRQKLREAQTGRVCGPMSEEQKQKLHAAHTGRRHTDETRRKLSGENNSRAKLTEKSVLEIRTLLAEGVLSQQQIAAMYGVSRRAISSIKHGHTWAYLRAAD